MDKVFVSSRLGLTKKEMQGYKDLIENGILLEVYCDDFGRIKVKPKERGSIERIQDAETQKKLYRAINNLSQKLNRRFTPYYHLRDFESFVNGLDLSFFPLVIQAFIKKRNLIKQGILSQLEEVKESDKEE